MKHAAKIDCHTLAREIWQMLDLDGQDFETIKCSVFIGYSSAFATLLDARVVAIAAERERCAKLAEQTCAKLAARIREADVSRETEQPQ